jgi:predicted nucleic acid-binding Zn ribbon protein
MIKREYIFQDGTIIDIKQYITDPSFTRAAHPVSGELEDVKRYFGKLNLTFKGSGFYTNDR